MIGEALHWLATPAPLSRRLDGSLSAAVGLWSRSRRCAAAWQPHHARCRAVVEAAVEGLPARRTVVVLGSGLLLDLPLATLARRFDRVVLVDLVHLLAARRAARRHRNVTFLARDLSGASDFLAGRSGTLTDPLLEFSADRTVDLVVSSMLLSQMPLPYSERSDLPDLPRRIVENHLAGLRAFDGRVALVTDLGFRRIDRADAVVREVDLLHGVALPEPAERWEWTVAPFGEELRLTRRVHSIAAWPDFRG